MMTAAGVGSRTSGLSSSRQANHRLRCDGHEGPRPQGQYRGDGSRHCVGQNDRSRSAPARFGCGTETMGRRPQLACTRRAAGRANPSRCMPCTTRRRRSTIAFRGVHDAASWGEEKIFVPSPSSQRDLQQPAPAREREQGARKDLRFLPRAEQQFQAVLRVVRRFRRDVASGQCVHRRAREKSATVRM